MQPLLFPEMAPRALCSTCESSRRDTKTKLCSDTSLPRLPPRLVDALWHLLPTGKVQPSSHTTPAHRFQVTAEQEEFRGESPAHEMTLQHQSFSEPPEKQQGCTCTRHSQSTGAESGSCIPCSCLQGMQRVDKNYSEAIYYGAIQYSIYYRVKLHI